MSNTDDHSEFARLIGPVKRLRQDRVDTRSMQARPSPRVRQRTVDTPAPLRSVGDIPTDTEAQWFQHGLQKNLRRRIQQGELPIDALLDLHGHRRDEALQALCEFFDSVLRDGCRLVVIVHGQGFGSQSEAVLKPLTQHWLGEQSGVLAWCPAQPKHGGQGATYVYLKNPVFPSKE